VKVADGYARNFLLPKRLAVVASESNKKIVEQERHAHVRREAKLVDEAQDLSKLLTGVSVTIAQKAGEADQFVRLGDLERHSRSAGGTRTFNYRPAEDPARGAHQATRRIQSAG